jgi:hypothetical protein
MSSRIAVITIDAVQPPVVADFWCSVLGWQVLEEDNGVITIASPDGSWPLIDVVQVPESKTVKNRLHLDLRADGMPTADELERLLDLGARRVDVGKRPAPRGSFCPIRKAMNFVCFHVPSKKPTRTNEGDQRRRRSSVQG